MPRPTTALFAAALSLALSAGAARAMSNQDFLSTAIKGDNSEISLGNLAADQGGSTGVKDFGKVLVTDHTQNKQKADALAKQMDVAPPPEGTPEAQQEYAKLRAMHGEAFDHEFVSHMIADHEKDIAEFKAEAKGNGPVAKYASESIPTLEKHLQMAESLKGKP